MAEVHQVVEEGESTQSDLDELLDEVEEQFFTKKVQVRSTRAAITR